MSDWRSNLLEGRAALVDLLAGAKRVAVLGMKTEAQVGQPAFDVPAYLLASGLEVEPVLVYYPGVTQVLGRTVYRSVAAVPGPIDIVDVFRRAADVPAHVDDVLAARPRAVWFQSGIRHDDAAEAFARAGIKVVQDRCLMVDYRAYLASAR